MKKTLQIKLILGAIALLNFNIQTIAQNVNWVKSYGTSLNNEARVVKVDNTGNSYLGGNTESGNGGFIKKYDNSGDLIWTKTFAGFAYIKSLVVDEINNFVYVTGQFNYSTNFGGITLTSNGSLEDIFILKMDTAGTVLWANKYGNNDKDCGKAISVDNNGDVYFTGYYKKAITFGTFTLTNYTNETRFLVKLNPAGTVLWAQQIGTKGNSISASESYYINNEYGNTNSGLESGFGLGCDLNNNVFVSGTMSKIANFETTTLNNTKSNRFFFLAKFNSNGNIVWVKSNLDNYYDCENTGGLTIDNGGNIITGGYPSNNAVVDTYTLINMPFITKFDNNGNTVWLKQLNYINGSSDPYSGCPTAYSVDGVGNPNIVGYFGNNDLSAGTVTLTTTSEKMYVLSFLSNGTADWGFTFGNKTTGSMYENAFSISTNTTGAINVAGKFDGTGDAFGTYTLTSIGATDAFNMRINGSIATSMKKIDEKSNYHIYPDPANTIINIQGLDINIPVEIKIYSIEGKIVKELNTIASGIDIKDLYSGIYFITIIDQRGHSSTKKFIKE